MENQFFHCTQRAFTQRRVITLGPMFIKKVLNRAQGFEGKKSRSFSAKKITTGRDITKNVEGGADSAPPPGSFRVKGALDNILKCYFWLNFIYHVKCNC